MQIHNRSDYAIAGRELVAEGADLRASAELDRLPAVVEEVRFATDSPLEGDGFEPSVPR